MQPIYSTEFLEMEHNPRDPSPWQALFLDRSIPINDEAKAAFLKDTNSWSRQFLLPLVRPLARLAIVGIQVLKVIIPNKFTSSRLLHQFLFWGLKTFVSPTANYLILRHFHLGSEILEFIAKNVEGATVPLHPLKPKNLTAVKDDLFLQHDLNLFNFVIRLNKELREKNLSIKPPAYLDVSFITDGALDIDEMPARWTNFLDLQSAIEIFTPVYQLFLTDSDFWRATNSLQLDETIGIYAATILQSPYQMFVVNNKHPLVPMITLSAAYRLMLHGLATETLHAILVQKKKEAAAKASEEILSSR